MKKRPLCLICITLVLMMWILQASGGLDGPSDVPFSGKEQAVLAGEIYQCEYESNKQVLYLKQTSLFASSQVLKLNNVMITVEDVSYLYEVSDTVLVKGILQLFDTASNPGQFDINEYYQSKRIKYTMWNPKIELIKRPEASVLRVLWKIRLALANSLDEILPNQFGALLKGMTLGDKSDISEETKLNFQRAGLSHLLAISGLHLQMLGNGLYRLLKKVRLGLYLSAGITSVFLLGYGMLTGNSVATVRALIMFFLNAGAEVTGRTYDGITGIALTAVVLVAGNPEYLSSSGFWLSFCAVGSFLLFKEKRKLYSSIIFYFFMLPITLYYFYEVPLYSWMINLFVVPTAGVVLISGLFGAVGSLISPLLGKVLIFPAALLLQIYTFLCDLNKKIPVHTMVLGRPSIFQVICYTIILLVMLRMFRKNARLLRRVFVFLLLLPALWILLYRGIPGVQIAMLDVGQGDCLVVKTETDRVYIVDGGSTSEKKIGEYRILPYLKYSGIRTIDGIFLSHADADHMNGIIEMMQLIREEKASLDIKRIILPKRDDMEPFQTVINLANELSIEVLESESGDAVADGWMTFTFLHPEKGDYVENENEGSMVLLLDYKGFSMLFTGDLEGEAEKELIRRCEDVDVLKVAHHGSDTSSSEAFLKKVRPEIAFISCGENNSYGHPHKEVVMRLEDIGAKIYRTDQMGAVTIRTNGEKIDLKTYKQYNMRDNEY